jgi:glycosyltransferase involved in cell wall biosynthesis
VRILINISVISVHHRGMGVFTKKLIKVLLLNNSHEYIFVSGNELDSEIAESIKNTSHVYKQINTPLPIFEQVVMPFLISKYKPEVCWFPSNTFPLIMNSNVKYIATVHDLIFLKNSVKPTTLYQKIGKHYRGVNIALGVKKLDKITSVSYSALKDIHEYIGVNGKIKNDQVLYNSVSGKSNEDGFIFEKLNLSHDCKYFYTISGLAPHKNLDFLIESFKVFSQKDSSYKLVISGASKSKSAGINKNIIFTPFVSEAEKTYLIRRASIFIFPSLLEGFGIPLLEGLYHNPNVLVSDIGIFREVGKNYVSYFNPYDNEFLIKYFESEIKTESHEKAKKYILKTFNLEKTAKKLESIFDEFK